MKLATLDIVVVTLFFLSMVVIGFLSYSKNKSTEDYFVASGKIPWWVAGISHHVSGHSGAVFVAYAALAYTYGFSIYVWWAFTIGITIVVSAHLFPVLWVRLRKKIQIQSPLEFLSVRYNVLTQQLIAWVGVLLKVFDVGAKWAAIAILLNVVASISVVNGILIAGGISLLYITFGGLWAIVMTDFIQFVVQIAAGIAMFVIVVMRLGGTDSIMGIWDQLPPGNRQLFNEPYTLWFALAFLIINFLSFNGGSWGLATRYISSPNEKHASKAAYLSGILYLIWPLILFFPMWAAPIILPGLEDPTQSYGFLMTELLPVGLIGLVVSSLFAATMAMTSSDINTMSAVITRDMLPTISVKFKNERASLMSARIITAVYTCLTILIAFQYERFGGVIGLIISWFGALLGPISVPLLFGLLPMFKSCGSKAAISSIIAGLTAFILTKIIALDNLALTVSLPVMVSVFTYVVIGLVYKEKNTEPKKVEELMAKLAGEKPKNLDL